MRDTPEEVARLYRRLLMARSGQERLLMGAGMFSTARALATAGLEHEGAPEIRVGLFLRFYGREFSPEERDRIIAGIRERGA